MYRHSGDYDKTAQTAIDIYVDYGLKTFPIDEKDVCIKLGVKLVPYSAYSEDKQVLFRKKSKDGFFFPQTGITPPTIFYNDKVKSFGRQRFSIFHELKHYVSNDRDDSEFNDEMADYFARYMMCPVPYLIKAGINDKLTLISDHLISDEAADNVLRNLRNRRAIYGDKIFPYEKPLIDLLF